MDFCVPGLGKPTEAYLEELRAQEEMRLRILENDRPTTMVGAYEQGTEFKARIVQCDSINRFIFKTSIFNREHYNMMRAVKSITYHNGSLMCLARPHTSDLGQIKLLYTPRFDKMHRCRIDDLYTTYQSGRLELRATVQLIDHGSKEQMVTFNRIYDMPQMISYYKDFEPEAKLGRIYLGKSVPKDFNDKIIDKYFCETIQTDLKREYTVKILDYVDNTYCIDLIDRGNKSFIKHLKHKFYEKIRKFEENNQESDLDSGYVHCELDVVRQFKPTSCQTRKFVRGNDRFMHQNARHPPVKRYLSVVQYFREKLAATNHKDIRTSFLQKRFFKVRVIGWDDPESFYLIPDDEDYYEDHSKFVKELESCQGFLSDDKDGDLENDQPFVEGQKCLFRNELDYKLGKWLRGVIIQVPNFDKSGKLRVSQQPPPSDTYFDWGQNDDTPPRVEAVVYVVRSIDYGFKCARTSVNLRHVRDERLFTRRGPWALRCQLFGIKPCNKEINSLGCYSKYCLDMIDSWIRAKILSTSGSSFFNILFRSDLCSLPDAWQSDEDKVKISLFYRYEPPYKIEECMMPRRRKTQYECLNWYLVERGLADDYVDELEMSSNIELDQHVVNLLVTHDRI